MMASLIFCLLYSCPHLTPKLRLVEILFIRKEIETMVCICSAGHTLHEVFVLREGRFARIPDAVVWPCK